MLKQIGILVDLEAEKNKLAAATGRATSEITLMEEKQLLLNAVMAQAPTALAKLDTGIETTADKLTRLEKGFADAWASAKRFLAAVVVTPLDVGGAIINKPLQAARSPRDTEANSLAGTELGPTREVLSAEDQLILKELELVRARKDQLAVMEPYARTLGVTAEQLQGMTDAERGLFIVQLSLSDQFHSSARQLSDYDAILEVEAQALLDVQKATQAAMKIEEDHARLLKMETEETQRLTEATKVLAGLRAEKATAELTRGGPEDAFRRIRQEAFSGSGGDTIESVQSLLATTRGVTGGDAGDRDRLLRDLTDRLEQLAGFTVNAGQGPAGPAPFGPGSQVITPGSPGDRGENTPRFGGSTITIPVYIGGEHLTTVTRKMDEQRRSDDALAGE